MHSVQSYFFPVLVALLMHGLFLALMSTNWANPTIHHKVVIPKHIAAHVVAMEQQAPPPVAKPAPKQEPEPAKPEPVASPAVAAKPKPKPKKPKAKAKPKPKPKPKAKPKADHAALARARERAAEIRRQQQAQQTLQAAMQQESANAQESADAKLVGSYIAMITRRVTQNWSRPPSARNGMQAELVIKLIPTGEVVNARVVRSSGNLAFDRSAEMAVQRAGRFPELQKMPGRVFERNFRSLRLVFNPEDLRQ